MATAVLANVNLWGIRIGVVAWDAVRNVGVFEYDPEFASYQIQPAPLQMPIGPGRFSFPALNRETYHGLPGLLADSLPDKFGNQVIDAWLARQGRLPGSMTPIERLCYVGTRGMGALEFDPSAAPDGAALGPLDIPGLVGLANEVLDSRQRLAVTADTDHQTDALRALVSVGTSAGGARAKAVVAYNSKTQEFRSGQIDHDPDFSHYLIKFDGISNNRDHELADPQGFGRVEFAYYLVARAAGIEMMDCQMFEEGGRAHFMTRRFDRPVGSERLHVQTLCALDHLDFNVPHVHGYEQAFMAIRRLNMRTEGVALRQLFLRMVFNLICWNRDDHTKNISFLMDKAGEWSLAPAYDVTFAYNPDGLWTKAHQMTMNGKATQITKDDLLAVARNAGLSKQFALRAIDTVISCSTQFPLFAEQAGVPDALVKHIGRFVENPKRLLL